MSVSAVRPEHPDFRLIAQALADMDDMADSGQSVPDILDRYLDHGSVLYAAIQRAVRSSDAGVRGELSQLAGVWTDGFIAGMIVRHIKTPAARGEAGATVTAGDLRIHVVTLAGLLDGMRKIDFRPGYEFSEYWRQLQEATTAIASLLPENAAREEPR